MSSPNLNAAASHLPLPAFKTPHARAHVRIHMLAISARFSVWREKGEGGGAKENKGQIAVKQNQPQSQRQICLRMGGGPPRPQKINTGTCMSSNTDPNTHTHTRARARTHAHTHGQTEHTLFQRCFRRLQERRMLAEEERGWHPGDGKQRSCCKVLHTAAQGPDQTIFFVGGDNHKRGQKENKNQLLQVGDCLFAQRQRSRERERHTHTRTHAHRHTDTQTHTQTHRHTHTHSLTHSLTHSHTHTITHTEN